MRRKEFQITDQEQIQGILERNEWATVAMLDDQGAPYQVTVNPLWFEGAIWFHSSPGGKKMSCLQRDGRVHLSMVEPLSIIPSNFTDPELACQATQFFLSLSLEGLASMEEDLQQKARVLQALMEKFQPQGGFRPIQAQDPTYQKRIKNTALIRVTPKEISAKFKLGQNLQPEMMQRVIEALRQRGQALDHLTIQWMEKCYPS